MPAWERFICIDWGKNHSKRRAWIAETGMRRVASLDVTPTLSDLLAVARALPGRTVLAIDAALGVPRSYLERARVAVPEWSGASDFLMWLVLAMERPSVLREAHTAAEWRHDRPFIAVPGGTGSLGNFWRRCGGKLLREIDVSTDAKSPFLVSGIPGTVGSGTRALWIELASVLGSAPDLAIWPFDGTLDAITKRIALAETYPRVCYSLALAPELPAPLMPLGKTSRPVRDHAVDKLAESSWVRDHGVALRDLELARTDEDDFDAMISAAAMLRCALEHRPLDEPGCDPIEGGILGVTSVRLDARRRGYPTNRPTHGPPATKLATAVPTYACPIDGCDKEYRGSRGGWDAHVGSRRKHPEWHPEESDSARRKELFRREHASWFLER